MHKLLAAIPIVVVGFLLIVSPLLGKLYSGENGFKVFLPVIAAITIILAIFNHKYLKFTFFLSPAVISLAVFMTFAGASVTWSINPDLAMFRWAHQMVLLFVVIVPFSLIVRPGDIIEHLHLCFLIALIINACYVFTTPSTPIGHPGYFFHKQFLGTFSAIATMVAAHELFYSGRRRILGILSTCLAIWLVFESQSKLAFGFLLVSPPIAWISLVLANKLRAPLLLVCLIPLLSFVAADSLISNFPYRVSWWLTGDATFTGRGYIWQVVGGHADLKPWFGWGFQSYWFTPNSPITQDRSYVKDMLSTHSGYLDVRVQLGHLGYLMFWIFILATFHGLKHVRRRDSIRSWLFLSLGVFAILVNYLDTIWLSTFDPFWILFVIIAAEGARYSQFGHQFPVASGGHSTR